MQDWMQDAVVVDEGLETMWHRSDRLTACCSAWSTCLVGLMGLGDSVGELLMLTGDDM